MRRFPRAVAACSISAVSVLAALFALGCSKAKEEPPSGGEAAPAAEQVPARPSGEIKSCDGVRFDTAVKACVQDPKRRNHLVWLCSAEKIPPAERQCLEGDRIRPVCGGVPFDPRRDLCSVRAGRGRALVPRDSAFSELVDSRDGKSYRIVRIGRRWWMAQNLDYADTAMTPNLSGASWCYDDEPSSCRKRGRLYTWTAAMDLPPEFLERGAGDAVSSPHRGVCPEGWHVPTNGEWNDLHAHVSSAWPWNRSQQLLKSFDWGGIDLFGFGARPTGYRYAAGDFLNADSTAAWWTASESTIGTDAYYRRFSAETEENEPAYYGYFKSYGRALRCAKDPEG